MTLLLAVVMSVLIRFQSDCPATSDFAGAQTQIVSLRLSTRFDADSVWAKVGRDLREWWSADFAPGNPPSGRVIDSSFGMIAVEQAQMPPTKLTSQRPTSSQRTCFFVAPNGNSDRRIAFLFATQRGSGPNVATLQLWWLGDGKGRSERKWQPQPQESTTLAGKLVARLSR